MNFYTVGRNETHESLVEEFALPEKDLPLVNGLRELEERDIPEVAALYDQYMRRFDLTLVFTSEELKHHLMGSVKQGFVPREKFVWTYVVEVRSSPLSELVMTEII